MYLAIVVMFIVLVIHNVLQHNRITDLERRLFRLENNPPRAAASYSPGKVR